VILSLNLIKTYKINFFNAMPLHHSYIWGHFWFFISHEEMHEEFFIGHIRKCICFFISWKNAWRISHRSYEKMHLSSEPINAISCHMRKCICSFKSYRKARRIFHWWSCLFLHVITFQIKIKRSFFFNQSLFIILALSHPQPQHPFT
jgi:hypothetical protein